MQDIITFISNHSALSFAAVVLIALILLVELIRIRRGIVFATPLEVTQMINHDNAIVVDIRSQQAYKNGHIIAAQSLSASEIRESAKRFDKLKEKPIIIVCDTGIESQKIAALLLKRDYNAYCLAGGIRAWSAANMPLVKE